jgi:hypothetical protein
MAILRGGLIDCGPSTAGKHDVKLSIAGACCTHPDGRQRRDFPTSSWRCLCSASFCPRVGRAVGRPALTFSRTSSRTLKGSVARSGHRR